MADHELQDEIEDPDERFETFLIEKCGSEDGETSIISFESFNSANKGKEYLKKRVSCYIDYSS